MEITIYNIYLLIDAFLGMFCLTTSVIDDDYFSRSVRESVAAIRRQTNGKA